MAELRLDLKLPAQLPSSLPVLPLRSGVLLPGGVLPLTVGRPRSLAAAKVADDLLLVAVQREPGADPSPADLLPVATLARIVERRSDRVGNLVLVVHGLQRVSLTGFTQSSPFFEASFFRVREQWPTGVEAEALHRSLVEAVEEAAEMMGVREQVPLLLRAAPTPPLFVDAVASVLDSPGVWKKELLQTLDPTARAAKVLERLVHLREVLAAQKSIRDKIDSENKGLHKEAVLRRQLKAIQEELGEGEGDDDLDKLKKRLAARDLPDEVRETVDRELRRLTRLNPQSAERSVAIDWLTWIADMPWGQTSGVDVDLTALETALDRSHHGLAEVKRQVVEHLAVTKLAGSGRADVLLLVGPPGVGKTSIGQAIADATGRKLVRVALGGVRDEAELRGHRRTYVGARPGRLVEGIRRAGTSDPVILLDEVDKLVQRSFSGNPAAALLEILDPEQNHHFVDHYLEVPLDLSRALFVATANDLSTIPGPLRDRMEILDIAGYTPQEKMVIARRHLLDRLATNAGLEPEEVEIPDAVLEDVIDGWTREAGVRQLQRTLGRIYRAAAVLKARGSLEPPFRVAVEDLPRYLKRRRFHQTRHEAPDRPGIATGLAWTAAGGDVLYVEASTLPGDGKLMLTGQLGDVMKESARAALTFALSHSRALGIPVGAAQDHDIHVHVPAGGVPKDGPSAGVTIFTALASLLSGRAVRPDVAMTGEATLRGRVLPVGGIKSKVLAAHRQGLRTVILPRRNEGDLEDVPADIREAMTFTLVESMDEVLAEALAPAPGVLESLGA